VLSYVDIAVEGHLHEVLDHLARRLELTSHRRLPLTDMKSHQRMHHRMQRQLQLLAALDAFSRIANRSFQNVKNRDWVNYTLDVSPPSSANLANSDGREILFVGLLAETWRVQITTLLCAALIEKLDDFAFVLLRLWADVVLKDQGPTPDKVRSAYVGFVVGLDQMIRTWCKHLVDLGFTALSTPDRFRRKLEKWQKEGEQRHQPIGALAQEILEQIPC
ncbi:MAG TPA: hypothetical protein VJ761_07245, partial [Ktedonobacteraceae bacterium]|nr:hypothetical protein [Ktedonobacteraceae bacterium]